MRASCGLTTKAVRFADTVIAGKALRYDPFIRSAEIE
jgi:hypothetical protein